MGEKINLKQYNSILLYLKDIELNNIMDKEDEYKVFIKCMLNSFVNTELFDKLIEDDNLKILRDKIGLNILLFLNFFDLNNDGTIKLAIKDNIDNLIFGNDIPNIIKDIENTYMINILTNLILYMRSDEYIETNEKFNNFYESCKVTNDYYKSNFKNVLILSFDNILSYMIILCVISIPILNLIKRRIAVCPNDDRQHSKSVITQDDIIYTINKMYGVNICCILLLVHTIVKTFIELNKKKRCLNQLFTCSCSSKKETQ